MDSSGMYSLITRKDARVQGLKYYFTGYLPKDVNRAKSNSFEVITVVSSL